MTQSAELKPLNFFQKLLFPVFIGFISLVVAMIIGQGGNDSLGFAIMIAINLILTYFSLKRKNELSAIFIIYFNIPVTISMILILSELKII